MNPSRRHLIGFSMTGLATALLATSFRANAQNNSPIDSSRQTMSDRDVIINAVNGIAIFADLRDWSTCRQSFTDRVEFDYTALTGGQPSITAADAQIQQWSTFFESTFKTTQHLVGSHVVTIEGDRATCVANFQAYHTYLDPSQGTWVLSGGYNYDLVQIDNTWKVNKMKLSIAWETGNRPF